MIKVFNKLFCILKYLMIVICFFATIYILLFMYKRLEKNPFGENMWEFLGVLIPYILVLIVFVLTVALRKKNVTSRVFFNAGCVVALGSILFIVYRTIFDQNMVLWGKYEFNMNFNYFSDQISQIKTMLYIMFFANVFLIIEDKIQNSDKILINNGTSN